MRMIRQRTNTMHNNIQKVKNMNEELKQHSGNKHYSTQSNKLRKIKIVERKLKKTAR